MNKSIPPSPSSLPVDICPVTSLPMETWPEWTEVRVADTYSVTFSIIGGTILHNQPSGRIDDAGTAAATRARERFVRESGLIDKQFVEIRNYGRLKGFPSKRGRLLVADSLLADINAGRLLGFWIYNAQLLIQAMYNVGAKINRVPIPTGAFRDYGSAMGTAIQVLAEASVATVNRLEPLQPAKEWRLEMDGYGVCLRLVDRDVLYTEVHGILTEDQAVRGTDGRDDRSAKRTRPGQHVLVHRALGRPARRGSARHGQGRPGGRPGAGRGRQRNEPPHFERIYHVLGMRDRPGSDPGVSGCR